MKLSETKQNILSICHEDPYKFVSTRTFEERGIEPIGMYIDEMGNEGAIFEYEFRPDRPKDGGESFSVAWYRFIGWKYYDNTA